MVMARPIRVDPMRSKVVVLSGGINESVTTLELRPGELLRCKNYMELEGQYGGYASGSPYEVYDGTQLASEVAATLVSTAADGTETWDDVAREARRAAILPIPGAGQARGLHIYGEALYAVRDTLNGSQKGLFKASATGWQQLAGTSLNPGGDCRWVNARFAKYPAAPIGDYPPVTTNTVLMFMVDGVSQPHSWDGYTVRVIDHADLPSNAGFSPAPVYPTHVGAYDNRLFLAFPGGHLFFSALGDPSDWSAVNGAGAIPVGGEITNLVNGPGNTLLVILEDGQGIRVIKSVYTDAAGDFGFTMEELSNKTGALPDTAARMLGDIVFTTDRGPTTLQTSERFGDFKESMFAKKTQRTFLSRKERVTVGVVAREYNQYRLFFDDGTSLYYTFSGGRLKSAGILRFPHVVKRATEGKMPNNKTEMYFTAADEDGYVYKLDSGTSFNGAEIETFLVTSYYHYGTPNWKHFSSLWFEITAANGMRFLVATDYDYRDTTMPRNDYDAQTVAGLGGIWGESVWGEFIWGGAFIQRPIFYVAGYGTLMSVAIRTSDKYRAPHIIHNLTAYYTVHDRRL